MQRRNAVYIYSFKLIGLVGNFHSTKIWEFTMKCHLCGNKIVVRTDPENTDYKFIEGARKTV
jgi:Uncharacterized conserved protein